MLVARGNCRAFLGKQRICVGRELKELGRNEEINIKDNVRKEEEKERTGGKSGSIWEENIPDSRGTERKMLIKSSPCSPCTPFHLSNTHQQPHSPFKSHYALIIRVLIKT